MIEVAIVEDNNHYRFALAKILESSNLFFLNGSYASAEEAMPNLLMYPPDIAIVDIQLPEMSGISLIRKIRHEIPKTQFLICSLHQDNEQVFEAINAGASGYILKESSPDEIRSAVKDLFMGGAPMSPYIARKIITLFQQPRQTDINVYGLSERELDVLKLLSQGLLYKEIAEKLFIADNTVKNHLKSIYKKLHVQNKIEAINKFKHANALRPL